MLSVKVVVGGGGTSRAVNVMEWPFPSSNVRVLSPAMHRWVSEVERLLGGGSWLRDAVAMVVVVAVVVVLLLGSGYNVGGGMATAAQGRPEISA